MTYVVSALSPSARTASALRPFRGGASPLISLRRRGFTHFIKDNRSEGWAGIQRLYLKRILEFLRPETPVVDITTKRIEEYASWRRTAVRGTTVNKELTTVRTMFDKAVDWKFIEVSLARTVKELPDDSAIHDRYLKPNEFEKLLAQSIAQRASGLPVIGIMFQDFPEFISVGVHTGLRLTEMLMLEFHDIDFENEIVSMKKKPHLKFFVKNYEERHIRLNSEALVALLSLKQRKARNPISFSKLPAAVVGSARAKASESVLGFG